MKLIISFVLVLSITATVYADGIILGYVTGNKYLTMDEQSRKFWLIGAMDGIMAECVNPQNNKEKDIKKNTWLGRCIDGLSIEQIKGMFEKELKENPEAWHAPAALILRKKMQEFCKGRIE